MTEIFRQALQDIATRDLRDVTQAQANYLLQLRAQQALDAAALVKEERK